VAAALLTLHPDKNIPAGGAQKNANPGRVVTPIISWQHDGHFTFQDARHDPYSFTRDSH
jgi:hypothetical protein